MFVGGKALFVNRNMRNVSIFVVLRLSDIPDNFDIQQTKTPNELNKMLILIRYIAMLPSTLLSSSSRSVHSHYKYQIKNMG
jgi:hypothetical protein